MEGAPVPEPESAVEGHVEVAPEHDLVHCAAVHDQVAVGVRHGRVQQPHDVVLGQGEALGVGQEVGAAGEGGSVGDVQSLLGPGVVVVVVRQRVVPVGRADLRAQVVHQVHRLVAERAEVYVVDAERVRRAQHVAPVIGDAAAQRLAGRQGGLVVGGERGVATNIVSIFQSHPLRRSESRRGRGNGLGGQGAPP